MNSKPTAASGGHYRWVICGLLLFSTTVNYMDRQVIGYLKEFFCLPKAQGGFGWNNTDYGHIIAAFTAFYAGITVLMGWVIDKIGTKLGLALSLIIWSVFGILNAFAGRTVLLHAIVRSAFGIGEAGNFPASIKTVAEWFPKRERALATGVFNSGSNIGAMISALFVPFCLGFFGYQTGWKAAYIITGTLGFIWLIFWFWLYDIPSRQPRLSKAEYAYIHSDDAVEPLKSDTGPTPKVSWLLLLSHRQTWAFFFGKFFTDGVWWFYLFWLPDYLHKQFNMAKEQVMLPTFAVYGVAIFGSIYGGSLPMMLMRRGADVYTARMKAMLIIAVFPLAVLFTQYFGNVNRFGSMAAVLAVGTICIAAAAHQAWSANLFTTVSDMFPKKAVGSVTGIGAMAGGLGGVIVPLVSGALTDAFKETPQTAYLIMFIGCAVSYLIAWGIMKALVPKFELVKLGQR
jgi:ACS family hexuronate transporter-like MFS transporter